MIAYPGRDAAFVVNMVTVWDDPVEDATPPERARGRDLASAWSWVQTGRSRFAVHSAVNGNAISRSPNPTVSAPA